VQNQTSPAAASPVTLATSPLQGEQQTPQFLPGRAYPEQGGVYAGIMRDKDADGRETHWHLFVPTDPAAEFEALPFGPRVHIYGTESDNDGRANASTLIASGKEHPAVSACLALTIGGLADWYLPARNELRLCYVTVPELFSTDDWYWSSTQYAGYAHYAWMQSFYNGFQNDSHKDDSCRVRAVRRLVIQSFGHSVEAAALPAEDAARAA
jgi:Protein of unknown function (DUF1566)